SIMTKLSKLNTNKSPGPDKIPNIVLRSSRNIIAPYLCHLYKISIRTNKIPDEWKHASVVPIYKSGDRRKRENYRPVSLTSTVCKVLEQLVLDMLWQYISERCPLSDSQFGFRARRSCSSQLMCYVDELSFALDKGLCADVAYLDLSKAFDKVSHGRLIQKLLDRNIPLTLVKWIQNFLMGRTQAVVLNNSCSTLRNVTSGVPQGSILGPILFLLYSDDVDRIIHSPIRMYKFADDMKLCHIFDPKSATEDSRNHLQKCLNNLSQWCNENCLPLNLNKCSIVHFGSTNPRYSYHVDQRVLTVHSTERDLGVIFDERLNFQSQIDNIVNRARRLAGLMLYSFQSRSEMVILPLYKTMVRPLLEYASVVWNPYLSKQIKKVESVQRYVTKRISGYSLLSYEERMSSLRLPRLSSRREYFDLVEMYKVMNGLTFVDGKRVPSYLRRGTRGHSMRIRPEKFKCNVRKSALFVRAVNQWNTLPSAVVEANSLSLFKCNLRKSLLSQMPIL
ncbi:MAG: reverse transcriptase family protein, partial [Thaumarchaeota archaeon]|nr:reverse transcriptase family protein [Nitrososphaerota archaeon]